MDAQKIIQQLAELIPQRDAAIKIIEEMESAFKAEAAPAYTQEKRLKETVEALKTQLRELISESGEKLPGVVLARSNSVMWHKEHEAEIVRWCAEHAPELLTLKGISVIREWFLRAPIQNLNVNGVPASVFRTLDGNVEIVVPCPFVAMTETQVRISESGILTAVDEAKFNQEHSDGD